MEKVTENRSIESLTATEKRLQTMTLRLIADAASGHPGSSLSCLTILTCLHYLTARVDHGDPQNCDADTIILSKGHAAPALYAILIDKGLVDNSELTQLRALGSPLQGHPDRRFLPSVAVSSGSLGQGLSIGLGLALAKHKNRGSGRCYVVLGDGECQEGQVWEAAMLAAHLRLENLIAIVDWNKLQHDGSLEEILSDEYFPDRWKAFGWDVKIIDGHSFVELESVFNSPPTARPRVVLAKTIKGYGIDYMEGSAAWHSIPDLEKLRRDFSS